MLLTSINVILILLLVVIATMSIKSLGTQHLRMKRSQLSSHILRLDLQEDDEICPICLKELETNDESMVISESTEDSDFQEVVSTQCNHKFHRDCLFGYLNGKGSPWACPICRYSNHDQKLRLSMAEEYHSPLLRSCVRGDLGGVEQFILSSSAEDSLTMSRRSCIHVASMQGYINIVDYLINHLHIPVNAQDIYGFTALHYAALGNRAALVEFLLLQDGIDVNAQGNGNRTPLMFAAFKGSATVIQLFFDDVRVDKMLRDQFNAHLLSFAVLSGDLETVQLVLPYFYQSVNEQDSRGRTALMNSVIRGEDRIVEVLLNVDGVNINLFDNHQVTALALASYHGKVSVVQKLLTRSEIEVDLADLRGNTPLMLAIIENHDAVVYLLLRSDHPKPDVNRQNHEGFTPLMHAISTGQEHIALFLLGSEEIDLTLSSTTGQTALSLAIGRQMTAVSDAIEKRIA